MTSFDPMAIAIDWLDAYRAASLSIVDLYGDDASLECEGQTTVVGRGAITEYWRQRFANKPAGELEDLQPDGSAIVVTYRLQDSIAQAILRFGDDGRIERCQCGVRADVKPFRPAAA